MAGVGRLARSALRLRGRESPRRREGRATRISLSTPASASSARAACVPAMSSKAPSRSPSRAAASSPRWRPARTSPFMDSECVSCGACVAGLPDRHAARRSRSSQKGQAEHSVTTTCAYCGVGCSFRAEMQGEEVVRMVPNMDGHANHGHSCVKGRFAIGYATHSDRIVKPMIRSKISDPWREVSWEEAIAYCGVRTEAHPSQVWPRLDRRHHLLALHQRGDLSGAEAGARRLRQQQRRHLRARLPFAHGLWPEEHPRRVGRHPEFRFGDEGGRDLRDRRESDRRPSGVRLADEAAPAPGREADRRRSAPHRSRAHAAHRGGPSPEAPPRHQRGADQLPGPRRS